MYWRAKKKNPVHSQNSGHLVLAQGFLSAFAVQVRPRSHSGGAALELCASRSPVPLCCFGQYHWCPLQPDTARNVLLAPEMSPPHRELVHTSVDTSLRHTAGMGQK